MRILVLSLSVLIVSGIELCGDNEVNENGSFESFAVVDDMLIIDSWSVVRGSVDLAAIRVFPHFVSAAPGGGELFIDINGEEPGAIATVFETIPGEEYVVSFFIAAKPRIHLPLGTPAPFDVTFEVTVSVEDVSTSFEITEPADDPIQLTTEWELKSLKFVATADETFLEIASTNSPNEVHGMLLDVVSVAGPRPLPELLGDINLDGNVNLLDVQPFVALLNSGAFQNEADFNRDCIVDLLDVDAFIDRLASP